MLIFLEVECYACILVLVTSIEPDGHTDVRRIKLVVYFCVLCLSKDQSKSLRPYVSTTDSSLNCVYLHPPFKLKKIGMYEACVGLSGRPKCV